MFILLLVCVGFLFYGAMTTPIEQKETRMGPTSQPQEFVTTIAPPMQPSAGKLISVVGAAMAIGIFIVFVDAGMRRKSLGAISGVFLGLVAGVGFRLCHRPGGGPAGRRLVARGARRACIARRSWAYSSWASAC